MNKLFKIFLVFLLAAVSSRAQSPTGLPSPKAPLSFYWIGWMKLDSGLINASRDTSVRSLYPGLQFLWQHNGVDSNMWFWDGRAYFRYLKTTQDVYNALGGIPVMSITTNGTSGPATLVNGVLNIPQYSGGGGGGNIVSLNGLSAATQFLITGTAGSDFTITQSGGNTNVFNLPTAGPGARGLLSPGDWTTFFSKQPQLNGVGFVKATGTTITYDNSTYYLASNPNSYIALPALSALSPLLYNNLTGVFSADTTPGLTHFATQAYANSHGGSGAITAAGNLSPLFTTSIVSNNLNFILSNAAANTVLGNFTGSPAGPTYALLPLASMAAINASRIIGNPTGSSATPSLISLGYGLKFVGTTLAFDSATVKDTVFAVNGLSAYGATGDSIGLGGRMYQNTTISGANAYALQLDSFPAASGRGFRVNLGSDAGYDMFYRDSATGYWKNFGKGAIGQVIGRPSSGGIGWINQTGGGGGGGNVIDPVILDTITQTTHTFSRGTTLSYDSTTAKYVRADTINHFFVVGVVVDSQTVNTFVVAYAGRVTLTPAQTHIAVGQIGYQSTTAGVMTATSPIVSIPVGLQINATTFLVQVHQPKNLSPPPVDSGIVAGTNVTVTRGSNFVVINASSGGGLASFTSPNSTITIGGTLTNPTVDINLANNNTWTGAQTFNSQLVKVGVGVNFPASSGTDRDLKVINNNLGVNGLGDITIYPSTGGTNIGNALDIVPKGTGYVASLKTILRLFNTDFIADNANYEDLAIRTQGSSSPGYLIYADKLGTGQLRQIAFDAAGTGGAQFTMNTNGHVFINSVTDGGTGVFQVWSTGPQIAAYYDASHAGYMQTDANGGLEFGGSNGGGTVNNVVYINTSSRFATRAYGGATATTARGTLGYAFDGQLFFYVDNTTGVNGHAGWTVKNSISQDTVKATNSGVTFDSAATFYIAGPMIAGAGFNAITNNYSEFIASGTFGLGFDKTHITNLSTNSSGNFVIAPSGTTTLFPATVSGGASINIPSGTAPSSPNNGDIWYSSNLLQARVNGITLQMGCVVGQTSLTSGTKAVTVTGVSATSKAFVTLVSQSGTTTTTAQYEGVCTTNTVTINAVTSAGTNTVNTSDASTVNYVVYP